MFIGHYGVSLAAKRYAPRVPLFVLFLAVQLLDVLFAIFLLAGIEKMRIVPGFTAIQPLRRTGCRIRTASSARSGWSALVASGCLVAARRLPDRERIAAASILGAAVFSHFALDVPMHTPDLPLAIDARSAKIGLGLWNHRGAAIALKLAALGAGGLVYLRASRSTSQGAPDRDSRVRLCPRRPDPGNSVHARPADHACPRRPVARSPPSSSAVRPVSVDRGRKTPDVQRPS